jgi:hypothetical protein
VVFDEVGLVVGDVTELDLLVLLLLGVDRRAGEGGIERRFALVLLPSRTSCTYSCGLTGWPLLLATSCATPMS